MVTVLKTHPRSPNQGPKLNRLETPQRLRRNHQLIHPDLSRTTVMVYRATYSWPGRGAKCFQIPGRRICDLNLGLWAESNGELVERSTGWKGHSWSSAGCFLKHRKHGDHTQSRTAITLVHKLVVRLPITESASRTRDLLLLALLHSSNNQW